MTGSRLDVPPQLRIHPCMAKLKPPLGRTRRCEVQEDVSDENRKGRGGRLEDLSVSAIEWEIRVQTDTSSYRKRFYRYYP